MVWYAIDSIDDAIEDTRSFLTPVSLRRWGILALISVFVATGGGSAVSFLNLSSSVPADTTFDDGSPANSEAMTGTAATSVLPSPAELFGFVSEDPRVVLVAAAVLVGVIAGLRLISATLRMALYDALATDRIALIDPAKRRFRQAVRLFGFTFGLQLVTAAPFVAIGIAVVSGGAVPTGPAVLVGGGILAGAGLVVSTLIHRLTHEFVVPTMIVTDSGVLDGWRRVWPVCSRQLPQFGVYLVVHFVLLLVLGTLRSILAGIVYLIVLLVGGLIGLGIVLGVFGGLNAAAASPAALVVLGLLAVVTLLVGWALLLPVRIVILGYVTIYEVSVLAAADDDLRLRPRTDDTTGGTAAVE
jgi:hypothetical protein